MPGLLPFADPALPASIRFNNPGAQWPGPSALAYGSTGYGTIGGGNLIAAFPDAEAGAAAQFDLLRRRYGGMPLSSAISKWSGGNSVPGYVAGVSRATGLAPDTVLTPELLADPDVAVPLATAMARHEAGRDYPLSDEQWRAAHRTVFGGVSGSPAGLPIQARDVPESTSTDIPVNAQLTAGRTTMPTGALPPDMGRTGGEGLFGGAFPVNSILGYLAGALQGGSLGQSIGRGLTGWVAGSDLDRERRGEEALGQFVSQAGLPEPLARAAASNPALAKTLVGAMAGNMFQKPTFGKIGQDAMGRETYGFIDPARSTVTPVAAPGGGGNSAFDNPQGLSGEDYLKSLDPSIGNTVRAILEGRMQPPTSFAASKPYWQGILQHAANAEPGFDLTKWQSRVGTAKDFASGLASRNVTSLNTVIGHLDTLREAADKLNNSSIPYWNAAANVVQSNLGDPRVKNFEIARNAVADEMAKVFRSSGMSDTEIRSWKETLGASNSPDQFKAVIGQAVDLMNSRLDALKDQYRRGAGKEPPELLSPKALKTLENVQAWVRGSKSVPAAGTQAPSSDAVRQEMIRRGLIQQ